MPGKHALAVPDNDDDETEPESEEEAPIPRSRRSCPTSPRRPAPLRRRPATMSCRYCSTGAQCGSRRCLPEKKARTRCPNTNAPKKRYPLPRNDATPANMPGKHALAVPDNDDDETEPEFEEEAPPKKKQTTQPAKPAVPCEEGRPR
ncbi:hypothetical protein DIPPA_13148 [Diplonema papillatum]|nr:hypothetical protein DIPPA_13148 [Diplonema papillatum]